MKFTVLFLTCLFASSSWAIKQKFQDPKDKREAPLTYGSPSHATHSFQAPTLGHEDASAVSIGAGYSVGGGKPQYSFGGHGASAALQIPSDELQSSGHAMIQLAPITLQPQHGASGLVSNDLSQLMSQLTQGFNSGAYTLQAPQNLGELYQSAGHNVQAQGGQELSFPQFTYNSPKLQQYTISEQPYAGIPSYASGTKGLGSYSSTGPVLFSPEQTHANLQSQNLGAYNSHSLGDGGVLPLGSSGHPLGGYSLSGSGYSLGSPYKVLGGNFGAPKTSFKPSPYIGSSAGQSDSTHNVQNLGSYNSPSFAGAYPGYGSSLNGLSGSSKLLTSSFVPPKSEGFGSSLEGAAAYTADSHSASPGSGAFSHPQSSYSPSASHAASSHSPQYFLSSSKHSLPSSFGEGSSYRAPSSGHGALSSYSSPPRYSFGSHGSAGSRYGSPKDTQGAYSESTYNTIKYSAELKPYGN